MISSPHPDSPSAASRANWGHSRRLEGDRKRHEEAERRRKQHEDELMRQRAAAEQKVCESTRSRPHLHPHPHPHPLLPASHAHFLVGSWDRIAAAQRQEEARKAKERQMQQMQAELQALVRETEAQEAQLAQLRAAHDQDATAIRELIGGKPEVWRRLSNTKRGRVCGVWLTLERGGECGSCSDNNGQRGRQGRAAVAVPRIRVTRPHHQDLGRDHRAMPLHTGTR